MRFALVCEDPALVANLVECFADDAIAVEPFAGELPLMRAMRTTTYDLVLIDSQNSSMLMSALLQWSNCNAALRMPTIVLTPFPNWNAMLRWIKAGATDVASRFDLEEIRLRAHIAIQREKSQSNADVITLGSYELRKDIRTVTVDGAEIALTPREFAMAWLFFSNVGKFLSRAQIAAGVWGSCEDIAARSIEQHIYRLRKKLRLSGKSGPRLKTVYALGYKLDAAASAAMHCDDALVAGNGGVDTGRSERNVLRFPRPLQVDAAQYHGGAERVSA